MTDTPYTVDDLAQRWRCSAQTVYRLARDSGLPHFRLGARRGIRFSREDVQAWESARAGRNDTDSATPSTASPSDAPGEDGAPTGQTRALATASG